MRRSSAFLLALCLFISGALSAQQNYHRCSSVEYLQQQLQADPGLAARMQQIEQQTQQFAQHNMGQRAVVTIPVVVHVVYNTAAQNISDAQIIAQINQLNLDYARLNADAGNTPSAFSGLAANTNVQFCLAQRDPNGAATTGIIRKSTTVTSFSTNDAVKKAANGGDAAWPATSYLNIWSCNLGGGLLGYAQFPGGSATTDGVVLLYSSIGSVASPGTAAPYNLGRTATHEVGHWLNLYHIWGDDSGACTGTDNVGDTPNQAAENYGCPAYPHTDACAAASPGVMFMNYMDYTDDGCMNMFTQGQATRMNALFASGGSRASLLSSLGCQAVGPVCALPTTLTTTSVANTSATFNWAAVSGATSYGVQYRAVGSATWITGTSATNSFSVSGLTLGTNYEWQVRTVCSSGTSAYTASATFTTTGTAPCTAPATLTTTAVTTTTATFGWSAASGATSYSIQYRIVGAATWSTGTSATTTYAASGLTAGSNYEWQVATVCSSGTSAYSASATFTTATPSTCSDIYESNNTAATAKTAPLNATFTGLITPGTDVDWFKFTTTGTSTKVKIDLTNLPADYDVTLYRSNGTTTLGSSVNGGTTAETIKYNATTTATYLVKVYGYNGATSASSCYTLNVSTSATSFRLQEGATEEATIQEITAVPVLKLYPNPATDKLTVEYLNTQQGNVKISVYNLNGQKVLAAETTGAEGMNIESVNTSQLGNGVYIFEINTNGETQRQKFTISR